MQRLRSSNPGHSSSHSAVSSQGLLRHSLLGDSFSLHNLWSSSWRVARLLGLYGLPAIPRKRSGNNNKQYCVKAEKNELIESKIKLVLSKQQPVSKLLLQARSFSLQLLSQT